MATNRAQSILFLTLPGELRNMVYELLTQDLSDQTVVPRSPSGKQRNRGVRAVRGVVDPAKKVLNPHLLSLAMVNRKLYNETILLYMDVMPTLEFHSLGAISSFVQENGPTRRNAIKSIKFSAHNSLKLCDLFETLMGFAGLERVELEVGIYADYGERGLYSQPRDRQPELLTDLVRGCEYPPGLREFKITRDLADFQRSNPDLPLQALFDKLVGWVVHAEMRWARQTY